MTMNNIYKEIEHDMYDGTRYKLELRVAQEQCSGDPIKPLSLNVLDGMARVQILHSWMSLLHHEVSPWKLTLATSCV